MFKGYALIDSLNVLVHFSFYNEKQEKRLLKTGYYKTNVKEGDLFSQQDFVVDHDNKTVTFTFLEYPIYDESLEDIKTIKTLEIEQQYKKDLAEGYLTHINVTMKSDLSDYSALKALAEVATNVPSFKPTLKDKQGNLHENISLNDLNQIISDIGINYMSLWQQKEKLKKSINSKTNKEDILGVKWEKPNKVKEGK